MKQNPNSMRKRVSMLLAAALAAVFISAVPTAANAEAASPVLLTFEDSDTAGAGAVGNAAGADFTGSFEGASTAIATPGVARTGKALEFTKAGQPWSGVGIYQAGAGEQLTSASKTVISLDYYSPDATNSPLMLKLEAAGGTPNLRAVLTAVPGWNRFNVDFSTLSGANGTWSAAVTYKQLALFPNFRDGDVAGDSPAPVANTSQKYFFDNVSFNGAEMPSLSDGVTPVLLTFEDDDTAGAGAVGNSVGADFTGTFEGASTAIATPGVARTGKALEFTKAGQPWSGVGIYQAGDGEQLTSATEPVISLDYYSPDATNSPLMLKLEAAGGTPNLRAVLTAVPGWNRFNVDFSTLSGANGTWSAAVTYKQLALFPNFRDGDVAGDSPAPVANTSQKYFFDNVSFNGAEMPSLSDGVTPVLLTFEDDDTAGAGAVGNSVGADFTGTFEGASTAIATPGVARTGKALEFTKAGQPWSGVGIYQAGDGEQLTSATEPVISLDYYSPDATNSPLMLKLEAAGGTPNLRAVLTAVPGWNRFNVDFSTLSGANGTWSAAVTYKQLALFPNFRDGDVAGDSPAPVANTSQKYFFDNVSFNGAEMPALPKGLTAALLTFEDDDTAGALVVGNATEVKWPGSFEGAETAIATPGVARTGKALEFTKSGQPWSGINLYRVADGENLTSATEPVISFDYYSPDATNSPVMLKLESGGPFLRAVLTAVPGWNRFNVDFSTLSGANGTWSADVTYKQVALFPNFSDGDISAQGPAAVAITGQKYLIDNVAVNGAEMPAVEEEEEVLPPVASGNATFSGTQKFKGTLTMTAPSFTGDAATISYSWWRCKVKDTSALSAVPAADAQCTVIAGATKATYRIKALDRARYIRGAVTAVNDGGTAYAVTRTTKRISYK